MSWYDDYMNKKHGQKDKPHPFHSSADDNWYNNYMSNAKATVNTYPTALINDSPQGVIDFIIDNLAAGVGHDAMSVGEISERWSRHGRDADEWHDDEQNAWRRQLQNAGKEMYERNTHYYEPGTAEDYLSQALQSAPSSLAMIGAGAAAGTALAPVIGTAGGALLGALRSAPRLAKIAKLIGQAGQAYLKGNTMGARAARTFIPDARTGTAALTSAGIESTLEEQNLIDQLQAEGMSREEAERRANELFKDVMAITTLANMPQYEWLLGNAPKMFGVTKPTKSGLLGKIGKFSAVPISEATEEGLQEIAAQYESGKPFDWEQVRDAGIVGGIMGAGFGGAGAAGNYIANRGKPSQQEQWDTAVALHNQIEADKYARKKYETLHGEDIARQSLSDAQQERAVRLRDWARDKTGNQMDDETYNLIVRAANKHGVPVEHALAQAFAEESRGNQNARSPVGAIGVMQLMPETAEILGVDPYDLEQNIDGGIRYLKQQYDATGNWNLAHAAYNAGLGAVQEAGGIPNYSETQNYVSKINDYLSESGNFQGESRARALFGVENYNMPTQSSSIDNQVAQLKDGWQTVIPQIGGILRENFGINAEISSAARSAEHNAEVGGAKNSYHIIRENGGDALDIVFDRETSQEEQNAIADYFKNTGLFSEVLYHDVGSGAHLHLGGLKTEKLGVQNRADQLYNQRISEGFRRQQEKPQKPPQKPLFDINAEDSTTQKLLEQFITEKFTKGIEDEDAKTINFFEGMFDYKNKFQNTPENRKTTLNLYGDEFRTWVENKSSQEKPAKLETAPTQSNRNAAIKSTGNKFLEELNREGDQSKAYTAFALKDALNTGNFTQVENILKRNGVAIPESRATQTQQAPQKNPVENNKPPGNVLPQPTATQPQTQPITQPANTAGNEKLIKAASKAVTQRTSHEGKKRIGNAILQLANQSGIAVPAVDFKSLQNGSSKKITEWQAKLSEAGAFAISTPQAQQQSSQQQIQPAQEKPLSLKEQAHRILATKQGEAVKQQYERLRAVRNLGENTNYDELQSQGDATGEGYIGTTPDDMVGNIAQRIADSEEARTRKLGDRYTNEQGEVGVAQGKSNITTPDDMVGNIAKNFAKWNQKQSNKAEKPQKIQPAQKNNRYGNTAEVITGSRTTHQVKYKVVEADKLNASHEIENSNVFANKNYPAELQPRNRERANMQAQVISMSNNLNPADLMDARDVNQGAPIVRNDDVVLNGNGRTAAIRYAYKNGKGGTYKNALTKRAKDFGLNADEISKMNQPVLVRELVGNLTAKDLQDITTTQTGGARMGASEQAQSDARKLSADTLALFPQNDNADLTSAEANDFLQSALRDIATPDELNSLTTDDGRVNQDGINRVKRALFALAYDDSGLISRMSESTDDNVRGATNALLTAAPAIAKVRVGMKNGALHNYDLSVIADAVKKLSALRDQNKPVAKYLQEQSLFGENLAEMKEILSALDHYKRAPNKITAFLKKIASNIQKQGDPSQDSLLGESEPAPLIDLIKQARQEVENNGEQGLFAQEKKQSRISAVKEQAKVQAGENRADLEKRVSQISGEEKQAQAQRILNVLDRGFLTLNEAISNVENIINPKKFTRTTKDKISKKEWNANKKLLSAILKKARKIGLNEDELHRQLGIRDEDVTRFDILNRLMEHTEKYFDKGEAQGKTSTTLRQIMGEDNITAPIQPYKRLIPYLQGLATDYPDYIRVDFNKGIQDNISTTPYGLSKLVEAHLKKFLQDNSPEQLLQTLGKGAVHFYYHTQYEKEAKEEYRRKGEEQQKDEKFSKRGNVDTRIDNIVTDEDLTPQQKLLQSFGDKLGVKTIFFHNGNGGFHGAHASGTTYINVNSKMPIGKVFWHESMHWLKANNPKLYRQLVKATGITDAQRDAYLERTGRTDLITGEAIDEEILADQFEDVAKRTGLLQNIAGKNRGLIERVIQWLKDTMNKFIDHFRNPSGKLTTKQAQALADEFGKIANQLKDANGQKIFRYNRLTHNIELADGRDLNDEPQTKKALANLANTAWGDKNIKYSLGNDNSSESLSQKISNKLSSWFSTPPQRRKKQITENLRRLSGHRILYGYVEGADDVVVDQMQKLIQSRNAYDWEKLLPVVGKEIAKNLKLNPTSEQSNYIADWLLTGALNNNSAEAKTFQKAMRENPAMAELLQETRDLFQEITDMSSWERVSESLKKQESKTFLQKLGILKDNFEEQFVNDLAGLTKLIDNAAKNSTPEVAEMIKRGCSPDKLAQISRGRGAIANLMVNGKTADVDNIRAQLAEQYTGVDFSRFKPMTAIIESVGGDWEGLQTYAVAKLSKEMYEYNRAHPELEEPLTPYTSESDADNIIEKGEAKFGQAQKDLVQFSNVLLAMQHDSGLITDNTFYSLLNGWKNYVPMAQVFDENEDYTKFDFLKRRKGHSGDTWSPIQIMIANAHKRIQACEQNKVKQEIAMIVRFGGFDSNLSEVPTSKPNVDNIITFRENGKAKWLETPDPSIKRAIDAMQNKSESAWLIKMLRAVTGFMRLTSTGGNPDFAAGNPFRDLPDAYIHNRYLGKTTPITELIDAWRIGFTGAWRAFRGKPLTKEFIEWQVNGGAQAAFVSGDVDYIQRSINDATTTRAQRYKTLNPKKFMSQLLDDFQKISEFTENITRLSTYTLAKKQLAKRNGGVASLSDKQLAARESREASIDFAKAGTSTRKINNYILFANAAVQGLAQWGYAINEFRKGNKTPLFGKLFRAATQAVALGIVQFAFAHGDDDRKKEYEQAQDWEKETYWILGGMKIPKGMDFGMRIMANFTDEFLSFLWDKKPIEVKRLADPIWNALPSLTATAITPAVEVSIGSGGYSFFRKAPIVPAREQYLDAEEQYDTNTSGVAKFFGQMTGWSPRKLDYLINGYFGFMGRFATHIPNYAERGGIGWDEMPMIRRFIFTPYKNPKIVKEYYEAYDEQTTHYNTYKATKKKPEGYDPALHARLKSVHETMRKLSQQEKLITDDLKLSYDERKAKLLKLEKKRVALCETVFQRAR